MLITTEYFIENMAVFHKKFNGANKSGITEKLFKFKNVIRELMF